MGWELVENRAECTGSEIRAPGGYKVNTRNCAESCKGISTMFAYGTNDYGTIRCNEGGCNCLCETAATPEGTCTIKGHPGYRLFRYENGMIPLV